MLFINIHWNDTYTSNYGSNFLQQLKVYETNTCTRSTAPINPPSINKTERLIEHHPVYSRLFPLWQEIEKKVPIMLLKLKTKCISPITETKY